MWTSAAAVRAGVEGDAGHVVATGLEPDLVVLVAGRRVEVGDGHDDRLDGAVGRSDGDVAGGAAGAGEGRDALKPGVAAGLGRDGDGHRDRRSGGDRDDARERPAA